MKSEVGEVDAAPDPVCDLCGARGEKSYGFHGAWFLHTGRPGPGRVEMSKYIAEEEPRRVQLCPACVRGKRRTRIKTTLVLAWGTVCFGAAAILAPGQKFMTAMVVLDVSLILMTYYALHLARLPDDEMGDALAIDLKREELQSRGYDALLSRAQFTRWSSDGPH